MHQESPFIPIPIPMSNLDLIQELSNLLQLRSDLAESLERLPHLVSLKLSECSFQGRAARGVTRGIRDAMVDHGGTDLGKKYQANDPSYSMMT